jgi:chromosome segregation ATPase
MEDHYSIDELERLEKNIEKSFETIEKELKSLKKSGKNNKQISNLFKNELKNIEKNYDQMKMECLNLKLDKNKSKWEEIKFEIRKKKIDYKNKIKDFESKNIELISDNNRENNDHLNLEKNIDHNNLNIQQEFERGDKLVNEMDKGINNMGQNVYKGLVQLKDANANLYQQQQKLDIVDTDLKEIDISLDRAKKQVNDMFKMLSQDKIITCLIITILIIIIAIIIVSACGGDKNKNFNVPHDIFIKSSNSTTSNQVNFFDKKDIIKYLIIYFCLFLL